jgi:hypothetical protein
VSTINKDFRVKHGLIVEANTHLNGNLQVDGTITGLQSVTANSVTSNITSFSTTYNGTAGVGQFTWNDGDGTLDLGLKGGEVTIQVGQETVVRVYNDSGSTLTEGEVVYISGSQGNRVAVKRAQANSESSSVNTVGMVTENILNGEEGYVTTSGLVNGLDTSTLTAGLIYLSPTVAGEYTQVKPIAPDHLVIVGYVNRIHATVGSIYIKVDNGYELEELHNVYTANEQNSDLLTYVSANTRWENKSSASIIEPAFNKANSANVLAQAAYDTANAAGTGVYVQAAFDKANSANILAQAAFDSANNVSPQIQPAFDTANAAYNQANTANNTAVSAGIYANTSITLAQGAFNKANTPITLGANNLYLGSSNTTLVGLDLISSNVATVSDRITVGSGVGGQITGANTITANTITANVRYVFADGTSQNTAYNPAVFNEANTAINNAASASLYANVGIALAQASFNQGNSTAIVANTAVNNAASASLYANSSIALAQASFDQGNSTAIVANTAVNDAASASLYANTGITIAGASFDKANAANSLAQAAFDAANSAGSGVYVQAAFDQANNANNTATSSGIYANTGITLAQAAFDQANTGGSGTDQFARDTANSAGLYANTGITLAQAAFDQANTGGGSGTDQFARDTANGAVILAQAAFNQANTGGGSGNVTGNIVVTSVKSNTYIAVPQSNITSKIAFANTAGANTLVDSFNCTQFRSVKYSVQITSPSGYQMSELSLVQFDTDAIFSEYGVVCSNTSVSSLGTFYANVSSNIVNLNFNGITENSTIVLHGVYIANTGIAGPSGPTLPPDLMDGSGTIDLMDGSDTIDLAGTVTLPEDLSTGDSTIDLQIDGSGTIDLNSFNTLPEDLSTGSDIIDFNTGSGMIDLNEVENIPNDLSSGPLGSIDLDEGSNLIDLN